MKTPRIRPVQVDAKYVDVLYRAHLAEKSNAKKSEEKPREVSENAEENH